MITLPACQRCGVKRLVGINAKPADRCQVFSGPQNKEGYLPTDLGIGGGDYLAFKYCLDCGQIQGKFPLPPAQIEAAPEGLCEYCMRHPSAPEPKEAATFWRGKAMCADCWYELQND